MQFVQVDEFIYISEKKVRIAKTYPNKNFTASFEVCPFLL